MTFWPEGGADKSVFAFHLSVISPPVHNDSMYVRFDGIRNTKTWSKSSFKMVYI